MNIIEGHNYVFPVVGFSQSDKKADPERNLKGTVPARNVYGTAFSIGKNFFLTAGHVLKNASSQNDTLALGFVGQDIYWANDIVDYEVIEDVDLGIIKIGKKIERAATFMWLIDPLPVLSDVMTSGFPHGLDHTRREIVSRALKGYVVSRMLNDRLPARGASYELSFPCPVGLSGSPVLFNHNPMSLSSITGMILGNELTRTTISIYEEKESDDSKTTVYETVEAFHRGIALQSREILARPSNLLGESVHDFLVYQRLIYGLLG